MSGANADQADIDDFFLEGPPKPVPPAAAQAAQPAGISGAFAAEFSEEAYLCAFPEIAQSVARGLHRSGWEHFIRHGRAEQRLRNEMYLRILSSGWQSTPRDRLPLGIDVALVCESGMAFIVGWVDDRTSPLVSLSVFPSAELGWNSTAIARCRRHDVETALDAGEGHAFGFWCMVATQGGAPAGQAWRVRVRLADGSYSEAELACKATASLPLRDTVLGYCAAAQYWGNRDVEALGGFDTGLGHALVRLNRQISADITGKAHVERYGPERRFRASIVVCLYGKPEFLFLQAALFSGRPEAAEYEFIYVSNSPELAETLDKEARIAARIYGVSLVLVTLPANAGFSAANNVAVSFARSDRVMIVNPDVFPREADWAVRHAAVVAGLPDAQTRAFGVPLYYDDGSLMHGGMFFEIDRGLSVRAEGISVREMIRVEHYGKGAPPETAAFRRSRPVPAITGAFMSFRRAWFEQLGGFNEDHLFGHYEDADLCLKSLDRGFPVWMHDLPYWHLEGKGSERRPLHEGGSLVNRWLFTRNWGELVRAELNGRAPAHRALNPPYPTGAALPETAGAPERMGAHAGAALTQATW